MGFKIGPYNLDGNVALAPMSGVTDLPFRTICREFGANYVVSEMVSSNPKMRDKKGSQARVEHVDASLPKVVQLVGHCPAQMAEAAQYHEANGAQIIDINMGCPAKKVTQKLAGSALLAQPQQVKAIVSAVIAAVNVPVTLKMRTGVDRQNKNGIEIAQMVEDLGVCAIAVHGRTRADFYNGEAEYETIAQIVDAVDVPIWANGDVKIAENAQKVLKLTGADGVMIGRGAQGRPWFFQQIHDVLNHGKPSMMPSFSQQIATARKHILHIHSFYPPETAVRFARKHLGWYTQYWQNGLSLRKRFNRLTCTEAQLLCLQTFESEININAENKSSPQRTGARVS